MTPQPCISFPDHPIQLAGNRRGLRVDVREPAAGADHGPSSASAVLDFIASNETLDRYDEIILADGWRLDNYRRNPVFQNAHQYGDVVFTLGKAILTEVRSGGTISATPYLFQRIEFAVDVNPMARIACGLYKSKFLNAVSVGFIPLRWETPADPKKAGYRRKYLEQELLEVSAVGIPANPQALQLGLQAGAIEKADVRAVLELLRASAGIPKREPGMDKVKDQVGDKEFCGQVAVPGSHAGVSGTRDNETQWLQLARVLREILRRA